jgi:putative N6-adenine-specific DNA methylase
VARELDALGIAGVTEPAGVGWRGNLESVLRANLWLRTASRVVVRLGTFHARTFIELERHARRIEWERFLPKGAPLRFRVTSRKSKLYHTEAIAQRLGEAVEHRVGKARVIAVVGEDDVADDTSPTHASASPGDDEAGGQLFVVRVLRDEVTVSVDSSGALLHRRGYRQALAKAPLRETLAAAMLLGSGWRGETPLLDPLCGSGTIAIEGAMIARRMAPGLGRTFSALEWPETNASVWPRLLAEARGLVLPRSPVAIHGSDRDAGAILAARANAQRADVEGDISLATLPLSGVVPVGERGLVLVNPPYGVRIGEADALRDLYATFGRVMRQRFRDWTVGILSPGAQLEAQLGLDLEERFATSNGGIPVRFLMGRVEA